MEAKYRGLFYFATCFFYALECRNGIAFEIIENNLGLVWTIENQIVML